MPRVTKLAASNATRRERKRLRMRLGWARDQIKLSTHGTTHLDAWLIGGVYDTGGRRGVGTET